MHRAGIVGIVVLAVVLAPAAHICGEAQGAAQTASRRSPKNAPSVSAFTSGTILGTAWRGDTTPFPQARVRLRDVQTGRGIARTNTDGDGRFRFDQVDPAAYVVELLANDDKVLAVGDLFSVTAANQSITLVRLSAKAPWFGGFWGNAASAVIAAASTLGVTANGSTGRPVSPQ